MDAAKLVPGERQQATNSERVNNEETKVRKQHPPPSSKAGEKCCLYHFFPVCTLCYPSFLLLSNINAGLAYMGKNVSLRIAASASVNQVFVSSSENKRKCVVVGNLLGGKHRKKKCCCVY